MKSLSDLLKEGVEAIDDRLLIVLPELVESLAVVYDNLRVLDVQQLGVVSFKSPVKLTV